LLRESAGPQVTNPLTSHQDATVKPSDLIDVMSMLEVGELRRIVQSAIVMPVPSLRSQSEHGQASPCASAY